MDWLTLVSEVFASCALAIGACAWPLTALLYVLSLVTDLRRLRNIAAHQADFDIRPSRVLNYIHLALQLSDTLDSIAAEDAQAPAT